jgi:hypothetical protein
MCGQNGGNRFRRTRTLRLAQFGFLAHDTVDKCLGVPALMAGLECLWLGRTAWVSPLVARVPSRGFVSL